MEENLDEILSDENSGPPLLSGDEAYLSIKTIIIIIIS